MPIFKPVVIMNIHKIIKLLMLQSISPFGMYLFKNTPIPLTSQRGNYLAKDPNCKLTIQIANFCKFGAQDPIDFHHSSKFHTQHKQIYNQ